MPAKRSVPVIRQVKLYVNLADPFCGEVINLLENNSLHLVIHDVGREPLDSEQISALVQHYDLERFLNPSSKSYKKNNLDEIMTDREKVIGLIAADNDLLRLPIVIAGGRTSVGFDLRQILGMLHIRAGGTEVAAAG